ncbi:hypothetical protein HK097_010373 [Rhizophlyctis rosea]|uniref:Uncharacterized protein n=1 Tax=Rhizophlyctis rosea TaxID=64517 RepID=A0AAD5S7P0_9FUNG|nr:hypothetical protein HK097_010373 [Rhizophlyctis rosea]
MSTQDTDAPLPINPSFRGSLSDITSLPSAHLTPQTIALTNRTIDPTPRETGIQNAQRRLSEIDSQLSAFRSSYALDDERPGLSKGPSVGDLDVFAGRVGVREGDLNTTLGVYGIYGDAPGRSGDAGVMGRRSSGSTFGDARLKLQDRFPQSVPDVRGLSGVQALDILAKAKEEGSRVGDLRDLLDRE